MQIHWIWTTVALADVAAEEDEQIRLEALYRPANAVPTAGIKPRFVGELHPGFSCKSRVEHVKFLKGRGRPPSPHLTGGRTAHYSFHTETHVRVPSRVGSITCTLRIAVRIT